MILALDIGGTKVAAGVVDDDGTVHSFLAEPSHAVRGPADTLGRLFALGRRAVDEAGVDWSRIEAVGIGCGGPLDANAGVLLAPPHLPGWVDVPVSAMAEEALRRPATLANDATAAAAGEHRWGAGAGVENMVYLTVSTGVGGGIVVDGHLYRGSLGNGGELGHVTVDWHGRRCRGCGRRGCLEAYVSGTSIAERAREALAEGGGTGSALAGLEAVTAADVSAAARAGDPLAREVWESTCEALACGLTTLVNVFEPELVVLGGGVTRAGDQLLAPVRARVASDAMDTAGRAAAVVLAASGDHVGVVGAAAIVDREPATGEASP
jgi:glucokinase